MIPTPSLHSQPTNREIIIKEEKPYYTDFLFQDSQDSYEDFTLLPSLSPYELGSSSSPYPPFSSQPDKPEHYPQPLPTSPPDIPLEKDNIALGHVFQDIPIQKESSRKTRTLIMTLTRLNPHLKMAPSLFKIFVIL